MRAAVIAAFRTFNEPFEGWLPHMYLDREGHVTTGMGNEIDSVAQAQALPWKHLDGSAATPTEIADEWQLVKSRTDLEPKGGGAFGTITQLRLSSDDVTTLVQSQMVAFESTLRSFFPGWDNFPADAQMGIMSMAWAMGPDFPTAPPPVGPWPKFVAAANAGDWDTAAAESQMAPTPGIVARNAANELLFQNAATPGINPETLYYPYTPATLPSTFGTASTVIAVLLLLGVAGWGFYELHKRGVFA